MSIEVVVPNRILQLGRFTITIATGAGPRILGFSRHGGSNPFASLPDDRLFGGGNTFDLLGGHRLWVAPEDPSVTYRSDSNPVTIEVGRTVVSVVGASDPDGLVKSIQLVDEGEFLRVRHTVTNGSSEPVSIAAWAITQFAIGGIAYLPQHRVPVDPDSVLPNRTLVVWPYTTLGEPELAFSDRLISVSASTRTEATKIGITNRAGWLAYALEDELFVKWAEPVSASDRTVDWGATAQCFRNARFLELETLGPFVTAEPGLDVTHDEWWTLSPADGRSIDEQIDALRAPPELAGLG